MQSRMIDLAKEYEVIGDLGFFTDDQAILIAAHYLKLTTERLKLDGGNRSPEADAIFAKYNKVFQPLIERTKKQGQDLFDLISVAASENEEKVSSQPELPKKNPSFSSIEDATTFAIAAAKDFRKVVNDAQWYLKYSDAMEYLHKQNAHEAISLIAKTSMEAASRQKSIEEPPKSTPIDIYKNITTFSNVEEAKKIYLFIYDILTNNVKSKMDATDAILVNNLQKAVGYLQTNGIDIASLITPKNDEAKPSYSPRFSCNPGTGIRINSLSVPTASDKQENRPGKN